MATTQRHRSYGRIGWLATTLALATALVVGSWLNYRGSRAAVSTLNRGQAELLEAALRNTFDPWQEVPDSAALQAFVDSFPQYSVTYIAVVREGETVAASIGTPSSTPVSWQQSREWYLDLGDRVRLTLPTAFRSNRRGGRNNAQTDTTAGPDREARLPPNPGMVAEFPAVPGPAAPPLPRGFPRLSYSVVEFEPVVASTLVARASRSLALAVVSASILTLAALLFWRTSERYAAARIHLEEQRRLSQLGEMSAVLAHEIRNPLASLKGTAQLLVEGLPEGSRELKRADRIVAEAIRLETLTSDLLDFARSGPILREEVDPRELLRESVAEVSGGAEESPVDIDDASAPERWFLDARRLRHALVNILQNAVQATPASAPPRVRVAQERDRLVYEIRDFGPGLEPGASERVFDPFFTTRTNGTGLGLAVARRVAEMHGGSITAGNHPEGGAWFRLAIPERQG
ncbi:MAG TPA: HAMP domain-containing sensor histidine kinase [Longimicrobiaceae bacterium]